MQSVDNFYSYLGAKFAKDDPFRMVAFEQVVEVDNYFVLLCSYVDKTEEVVYDVRMCGKSNATIVYALKGEQDSRKALAKFCEVCFNLGR